MAANVKGLVGEQLPPNWSYAVTRDGRIFFIDDNSHQTSWLHPVTGIPVQTGFSARPVQTVYSGDLTNLPPGWEHGCTSEGVLYFIDHRNRATTLEHPIGREPAVPAPTSPPPQLQARNTMNRKSSKSRNLKPPSASRGENSKVILRGWLYKQESSGLKLWKKKWCVLADFGLFLYKDEGEQNSIGSILLPSYSVNPCTPADSNRKFAFKAEHENMKTFFLAAENQPEMERWVEALRMASLVQKAPGSGPLPKLIPKSPIMSWDDSVEGPSLSPPDLQQFPFTNANGDTSRISSDGFDSSFRDRSPLRAQENTPNYSRPGSYGQDPRLQSDTSQRSSYNPSQRSDVGSYAGSTRGSQRGSHAYNPSGDYGILERSYQGEGNSPNQGPPNGHHYPQPQSPSERDKRSRGSLRSDKTDQRSYPGGQRLSGQGQYPSNTLPRDMKLGYPDRRSQEPSRGQGQGHQGFNSLPRDQRARIPSGGEGPFGHSSPRQGQDMSQRGQGQDMSQRGQGQDMSQRGQGQNRRDDVNPYMAMTSPHIGDRKMDPSKHSNRPLPQEPVVETRHDTSRPGAGDYASLTRFRDKWPNQTLSDWRSAPSQSPPVNTSSSEPRPDLYVDIPHTYVNVYDESQVRDNPPELPMRPPLPAEMRHQIVEDIAKNHSPNTRHELITAETNLELRMKQPAFFNYPTPTRETLPAFPQDSPRSQVSQRSQRSQRSNDSRSQYPRNARRPEEQSMGTGPVGRQDNRDSYKPSGNTDRYQPNARREMDGSDDTITNEDKNDHIREFYGLDKYNDKNRYGEGDRNRFKSELDVHSRTLPSKPIKGITGEKDFRLRSLPDHVQSMPAIYHDRPLSIEVPNGDQGTSSYINYPEAPSRQSDSLLVTDSNREPVERKSAFRALSSNSNSLQRIPSSDQSLSNYPGQQPTGSQSFSNYPGQQRTEGHSLENYPGQQPTRGQPLSNYPGQQPTRGQPLSSYPSQQQGGGHSFSNYSGEQPTGSYNQLANYKEAKMVGSTQKPQMSQSQLPWKQQESLPVSAPSRGYRGPAPIQTVKEEPDMPDSDIIATELPKRVFNLDGPRLRMSISAGDLLGKNHDELVLLLIQLRRDKAELNEQRDGIRKSIEQSRPAEFYYRKLQNEGRPIDGERDAEHRRYVDMKRSLEELENKLEVYKPLVNLVCNMVTMGSLYGGDNLMLATEYRKHLLSPEQYSPPKKMLEFSRRNQEDRVVQEIEEDVRELTKEQADLEEKLDRLYELDRTLQDQSFQVTSLREDRELLERALGGLLKKQDESCTNPRELDKLVAQQRTIERELSRVLQQLAEASKELEETTAENNKIEHEVALLRSKVHGNVSRSKSAPSLSSESLRTKMKMEKDLARVNNIMAGLSQEGARLHEMMSSLRQAKTEPSPTSPSHTAPSSVSKSSTSTYYETDLDTTESKDLAQVTALLASYKLLPDTGVSSPEPRTNRTSVSQLRSPPPSTEEGTSAFRTVSPREDEMMYRAAPVHAVHQSVQSSQPLGGTEETDGPNQWDIAQADDNTKRFFGLIPKHMPKSQTVRDVKRISETRKEEKKKEEARAYARMYGTDPPAVRVGGVTSDYTDPNHVYENLPQQKNTSPMESSAPSPATAKFPWMVLANDEKLTSAQRRRSATHLMAPKPFSKPTPFSNISNVTAPYSSTQSINQSEPLLHNQDVQISQSQPVLFTAPAVTVGSSYSSVTPSSTDVPALPSNKKSPPIPPVRGTSKLLTAEMSQQNFLDSLNKPSNRNYAVPAPAILKKGKTGRAANKARYMTISSSQPIKLETQSGAQSPKLHSQAGDLISSMEVPDIVKSSTARTDNFDERTIEREILFFPQKVEIPERYVPDSDDDDDLTEEERAQRKEKADKIKRILTQQSVHSLSQPDVSRVAGEVHERVQQEKLKRAQLLGIGHELAEQVKRKSRQFAAERRKTWSGSTPEKKEPMSPGSDMGEAYHGDSNNNSYMADGELVPEVKDMDFSHRRNESLETGDQLYGRDYGRYREDIDYSGGDNSFMSSPYIDTNYTTTSYDTRPNFKI